MEVININDFKRNDKPSLLIYADDYREHTGFAKEVLPLLEFFEKDFNIFYYAIFGKTDTAKPFMTFGSAVNSGHKIFDDRLDEILEQVNPDCVFAVQDIQVINNHLANLCLKRKIPVVSWDIIDCRSLPIEFVGYALNVEKHIYQTEYCKKAFEDSVYYLHNSDFPVIRPSIAQEYLDKIRVPKPNKNTVGFFCNGKNIPRKFMTTLLHACELLKSYEGQFDVIIHTQNLNNISSNIKGIRDNLGLQNIVKFTSEILNRPGKFLTNRELAEFYHVTDFFVLPTGREGLGIPFLEAMACGSICIGTDHAATGEILSGGRGILLKPCSYQYEGSTDVITNAIVSIEDLAQAMLACMIEPQLQSVFPKMREEAYRFIEKLNPAKTSKLLSVEIKDTIKKSKNQRKDFIEFLHIYG